MYALLLPASQPARPPREAGLQMSNAISSSEPERARMTTVDAIVRATGAPADVVRALYEEEAARLDAQARLKQFVPLLAMRCVKQRLRELNQRHR